MCTGLEMMALAQGGSALAGGFAQMQAGGAQGMVLDAQAQAERDAAKAQAAQVRQQTGQARGAARAALAGAGVDVASGTAQRIDEDVARRGEQDALMLLLSGDRRAREAQFAAQQARAVGRSAMSQAVIGATGAMSRGRWRGQQQRQVDNFSPFLEPALGGDPFAGP